MLFRRGFIFNGYGKEIPTPMFHVIWTFGLKLKIERLWNFRFHSRINVERKIYNAVSWDSEVDRLISIGWKNWWEADRAYMKAHGRACQNISKVIREIGDTYG
jgi:hypothetical protein